MTNILVIGATGNIGLLLIQALTKRADVQLFAAVHSPAHARATLRDLPVQLRKFDFLDAATFDPALAVIDKVFFVRPPQLAKPKTDMYPFLDALVRHGIKQVVFVSLLGVEHNPMTPHHKIEKRIEALGLPYTFIRPSFFMQNLNTTHRHDIVAHHDLFVPAGRARTSFIDTRDIGAVAATVLCDPQYIGQKLAITGDQALTYAEVAKTMTAELGVPITYSRPSLLHFRHTMIARGLPKNYVNVMVMLYLITQMGNAKEVTTTLPKVLGRPAITFAQYVRDYRRDFLPEK